MELSSLINFIELYKNIEVKKMFSDQNPNSSFFSDNNQVIDVVYDFSKSYNQFQNEMSNNAFSNMNIIENKIENIYSNLKIFSTFKNKKLKILFINNLVLIFLSIILIYFGINQKILFKIIF